MAGVEEETSWCRRQSTLCPARAGLTFIFTCSQYRPRAYSQFCPRDDSRCHCEIRARSECPTEFTVLLSLSHSNRALFHAINPSATGRSETGYDVVTLPARRITVLNRDNSSAAGLLSPSALGCVLPDVLKKDSG